MGSTALGELCSSKVFAVQIVMFEKQFEGGIKSSVKHRQKDNIPVADVGGDAMSCLSTFI